MNITTTFLIFHKIFVHYNTRNNMGHNIFIKKFEYKFKLLFKGMSFRYEFTTYDKKFF